MFFACGIWCVADISRVRPDQFNFREHGCFQNLKGRSVGKNGK